MKRFLFCAAATLFASLSAMGATIDASGTVISGVSTSFVDEYVFGFSGAVAATLTVNGSTTLTATNMGWYNSVGTHDATNPNYITGMCNNCATPALYNDFFVFNLASVRGAISSASLNLFEPSNGYVSPKASELFTLFDVSTPISTLIASTSTGTAVFADLGSGVSYGARSISAADNGTTVSISLNAAALAAIQGAEGSSFAVGGSLAAPTTGVPEPGTYGLMAMGMLGLVFRMRKKKSA